MTKTLNTGYREEEMKKICYYQLFRPYPPVRGWGNCRICLPNEKNKECGGYLPITINTFTVRRKNASNTWKNHR